MFQYAVARGTGNNKILFDLSLFKNCFSDNDQFTARPFELSIFSSICGKELNSIEQLLFNSRNLLANILRCILYGQFRVVKQVSMELVTLPKKKQLVLQGYFQSERYFSSIRNKLLVDFEFPPLDSINLGIQEQILSSENSVSIHIRRGDYLKPAVRNYHGVLPLEYYRKAIENIEKELVEAQYFIFSDDPEWCETNLQGILWNFTIVRGNDGKKSWKDMFLMTQCRHHIIANSSFSWWGAWLGQKAGINYAPYKWFNPEVVKFNIHDFVPDSWRIVYYE